MIIEKKEEKQRADMAEVEDMAYMAEVAALNEQFDAMREACEANLRKMQQELMNDMIEIVSKYIKLFSEKMTKSDTTFEIISEKTRMEYTQRILNIAIKNNIDERFVRNFKQLIKSIYENDFWYIKNFEQNFKANNDEGNKAILVFLRETSI